jgi:hypothetical protein
MSHRSLTRSVRTPSEEPLARFNWPPTDHELAQCSPEGSQSDTEFEAAGTQPGELFVVDASPATDALNQFPSETDALTLLESETRASQPPEAPQETLQTPSDSGLAMVGDPPAALFPPPEPFRARSSSPPQSWTPGDGAQTRYEGEDLAHAWSEAVSTSGIAGSPSATALDVPGTGDLAGEIAHLQALIGRLTQQIEWRTPNVTGR